MDNYTNEIKNQAMETIELAQKQIPTPEQLHADVTGRTTQVVADVSNSTVVEPAENNEVSAPVPTNEPTIGETFEGLPIESLICAPIVAAAKGQQELTSVYVDSIMQLAYAKDEKGEITDKCNTLSLKMQRPMTDSNGETTLQECEINAPLLSLVPLPAFTMDELTVDFTMEVKASKVDTSKTEAEVNTNVNFKSLFGLNTSITGKVASNSSQTRDNSSSATYNISARAVQQPPTEGMNRLTELFARMMEPVPTK